MVQIDRMGSLGGPCMLNIFGLHVFKSGALESHHHREVSLCEELNAS